MLESKRIADTFPGEPVNARTVRDQASLKVFEEKRGLTKFYDSVKKAIDGELQNMAMTLATTHSQFRRG